MKCIYCENPYTYLLNDKQRKCGKCKRKFSPQKILRETKLRQHFADGINATQTSKALGIHIATVQKHFERFRRTLAVHADRAYQAHSHLVTSYDEYLYLPKSLDPNININKLQHFLTLSYTDKVYNIMMPNIQSYTMNTEDEQERKLLLKYLRFNKVAELSDAQSIIRHFWEYFEYFILQYKGVSDKEFIFYLKEAEWRFNNDADIRFLKSLN